DRNTAAFIGADPSGDADATPTANSTLDLGAVSLSAKTDGTIVALAVAGTVNTSQTQALGDSPDDALDGATLPALFGEEGNVGDTSSGIGVAGSAVVNVISDTTLAYVNTAGSATVTTLTIGATNDQNNIDISGGVAIAKQGTSVNGAPKSYAGAFGLNQSTATTRAFMDGLSLTSTAPAQSGGDQVSVSATRSGEIYSFTAALDADTTPNGKDFAGSVSINRVIDTTQAVIDSAMITQAGNVGLYAKDSAAILAVGGGLSFTAGARGVGASIGFNQISGATEAEVTGNNTRS